MTASCHHPKAHPIPLSELKKDYKALHNTEFKKKQRKKMLDGERPSECEYCWKIEDIDRNNVSDRVFKSIIYKENDVSLLKNKDWKESVDLKTLEISFDRTCNFACSYCNPGFSSTWVKDIKEQGKYTGLSGDAVEHYTTTNDWGQIYKPSEENPYVDAFWKWWPELSKTLFELRVTGGEPLMSPQFWKLVDWFTANEGSRIRFAANSNLGSDQKLIDKLIEKSHFIKTFDLYTSCESIDFQAEYIRDGLVYKNWKNNLINVIEKGRFRKIVIMMTVNALCLFGITDFMDQMLEIKNKYGRDYPIMSLNILRYPSFQSAAALPDHIKEKAKNQLQAWFDKNKNSLSLHQFELDGIQRLIDYLDVVKTPNPKAASQEELWKNFKNFYTQYDKRRGKNLYRTFPTLLTDWMDTI
ncbi:MAG: twitch domain-containing radical SAM protein [Pseudobdellovibrio sp.]